MEAANTLENRNYNLSQIRITFAYNACHYYNHCETSVSLLVFLFDNHVSIATSKILKAKYNKSEIRYNIIIIINEEYSYYLSVKVTDFLNVFDNRSLICSKRSNEIFYKKSKIIIG